MTFDNCEQLLNPEVSKCNEVVSKTLAKRAKDAIKERGFFVYRGTYYLDPEVKQINLGNNYIKKVIVCNFPHLQLLIVSHNLIKRENIIVKNCASLTEDNLKLQVQDDAARAT